jgi:hypothetical protein
MAFIKKEKNCSTVNFSNFGHQKSGSGPGFRIQIRIHKKTWIRIPKHLFSANLTLPLFSPRQVALNDDIYVQSHINAKRFLALELEQCWLSAG